MVLVMSKHQARGAGGTDRGLGKARMLASMEIIALLSDPTAIPQMKRQIDPNESCSLMFTRARWLRDGTRIHRRNHGLAPRAELLLERHKSGTAEA